MAQSTEEECGICLDALMNPVTLPCSHKFCSKCLDSWRSKYGCAGDRDKLGRACPLCRKKIPPSKEVIMQLEFQRDVKKEMEANGDTLSRHYMITAREVERLEQEVGDWTEADALDYAEDSSVMALPLSIYEAARDDDVQKVLNWLGPPPVDKKRIYAKCAEAMNTTLIFHAVMAQNSDFLSILLQYGADVNALNAMGVSALTLGAGYPKYYEEARLLLEWGAEIDPQQLGKTTKEEVVLLVLSKGNVKLANLLKSELGGRRCELVNFTKSPELNGKTCVVEKHLPDKDRYKITFEGSKKTVLVPPHNLKRRDRTPTDCGYYITFENGCFSRCDFASKEECQAYVAELESKHATSDMRKDFERLLWQQRWLSRLAMVAAVIIAVAVVFVGEYLVRFGVNVVQQAVQAFI